MCGTCDLRSSTPESPLSELECCGDGGYSTSDFDSDNERSTSSKNLSFMVSLTNKSNGSKTNLSFSAVRGTDEYKQVNLTYNMFSWARLCKSVCTWDGCEYYVDSLEKD
jgi:hypothetical protein